MSDDQRMTVAESVAMSKHAPGWSWRKGTAGQLEHAFDPSLGPSQGGLCWYGWHNDCPQRPLADAAGMGQCSCPCHHAVTS